MTYSELLAQQLFNMVYGWGKVGIVVDENSPAFQSKLNEILENKRLKDLLGSISD